LIILFIRYTLALKYIVARMMLSIGTSGDCSPVHNPTSIQLMYWSQFMPATVMVNLDIVCSNNNIIHFYPLPENYDSELQNCEQLGHSCQCQWLQNVPLFITTLAHFPRNLTKVQRYEASRFNDVDRVVDTMAAFGMPMITTVWLAEHSDIDTLIFDYAVEILASRWEENPQLAALEPDREAFVEKVKDEHEWLKHGAPYDPIKVQQLNPHLDFPLHELVAATKHSVEELGQILYDYENPNGNGLK
jgi:hypothetical protein